MTCLLLSHNKKPSASSIVFSLVLLAPPSACSHRQVKKLKEEGFANYLRSLISDHHTNQRDFYNITLQPETEGTTHVSVVAEDGSAASITSTINQMCVLRLGEGLAGLSFGLTESSWPCRFGSRVYSQRTGILLNNQLADFCHRVREINEGDGGRITTSSPFM